MTKNNNLISACQSITGLLNLTDKGRYGLLKYFK